MPAAAQGPKPLELRLLPEWVKEPGANICVAWCFPLEKWVFSPCTSERMVVHTNPASVLGGAVQAPSAVGWVVHPLLVRDMQKVHCRDCSFSGSSHML